MEKHLNPYTPGAGTKPLVIAGRATEVEKAETLLKSVKEGNAQRSLMLYGLRGVGKTVLLNEMERISESHEYISEHLEMSEKDDFRRVIAKVARKILLKVSATEAFKDKCLGALRILKSFTLAMPDGPEFKFDVDAALGEADSGDLDSDLTDLLVALGEASKEKSKYVCFFIDEVQYLKEKEFSALIAASHRISQKNLPIVFICAGLPQVAALSGDAKSYAERLFDFIPVGSLSSKEAVRALVEPATNRGVSLTGEAVSVIIKASKGYPYFIQELGSHTWNVAETSPIDEESAEAGKVAAVTAMDKAFFKVRMDRSTAAERDFMLAMASLANDTYRTSDVATRLKKKNNSIGPVRATLISKGFIYSPRLGEIAFTVPLFDDYIRRHYDLSKFNAVILEGKSLADNSGE